MSQSNECRNYGNDYFQKAKKEESENVKRNHFLTCLGWYKKAKLAAATAEEKCKATKNLAVTYKFLGNLEWEIDSKKSWEHFTNSIQHYINAAAYSQKWSDSWQWLNKLSDDAGDCLHHLLNLTKYVEASVEHLQNLHKIAMSLIHADYFKTASFLEIAVNFFCEMANRYLHLALFQVKSKNFAKAYNYSMEMHFPIEEAGRFASRDAEILENMINEIESLKSDKYIQENIFHANTELKKAKHLLTNLTILSKEWVTEGCLALDSLRIGYELLTEDGLDFILEAEICTYIGLALFKILKNKSEASTFMRRCIEMVLTFEADNILTGCRTSTWYQLAEKTLREIQEEVLKEDAKAVRAQKKKLIESGTVDNLQKEYEKGVNAFLEYIYKKFPMKDSKLPKESLKKKKRLQQAMKVYHPDKHSCNPDDTEEVKYKYVLTTEIAKHLTNLYGVDC